jgi:hypothetical protein
VLSPVPFVWVYAVRPTLIIWASAAVGWPEVKVPAPVVKVAIPDQYETLALEMVSAGLLAPVTKSVATTVAVQIAVAGPRWSVTFTGPS